MRNSLPSKRCIHPGAVLREKVISSLGRSRAEISRHLGVSPRLLYAVLNEKQPLTAELALRIERLTGTDVKVSMSLQRKYDLEIAERALRKELKAIPRLEAAE